MFLLNRIFLFPWLIPRCVPDTLEQTRQGSAWPARSAAVYGLQNLISGGNAANSQEIRFPKAGRYGLVCFFNGHHVLGMYRVITVK